MLVFGYEYHSWQWLEGLPVDCGHRRDRYADCAGRLSEGDDQAPTDRDNMKVALVATHLCNHPAEETRSDNVLCRYWTQAQAVHAPAQAPCHPHGHVSRRVVDAP